MNEPIVFETIVEAENSDEFVALPTAARIRLTQNELDRIHEIARVAKHAGLASARIWSSAAEYGYTDDNDEFLRSDAYDGPADFEGPFRTECDQMEVGGVCGNFYVKWIAYWRHTNVRIWSSEIPVEELTRQAA